MRGPQVDGAVREAAAILHRMSDPAPRPPIVHEDVRALVAAVVPPGRVPWRKRLFWAVVLRLAASPRGLAWLSARYRP